MWHRPTFINLGPQEKHDICLLSLSPGGSDAEVIREFNVPPSAKHPLLDSSVSDLLGSYQLKALTSSKKSCSMGCPFSPAIGIDLETLAFLLLLICPFSTYQKL